MMKKAMSVLLSLALLLSLLPGCLPDAGELDPSALETEELKTARELADLVLPYSDRGEALNTEYLNTDEDADQLAVYIEAVCELPQDQWEDAAIIRSTGASAFELFILRVGDEDAAARMETVLTDYRTARQGDFTGYAPAEAEMAANGRVRREGRTLGLFICPDADGAEAAFAAACKGEELPPLPEPDAFEPPFAIRDLLHRLLLEAACPEWRGGMMDAAWVTGDSGRSATAFWGDGYAVNGAMNAAMNNESVEDGLRPLVTYQVTVYLTDSEDAAKQVAEKWNGVLKAEAEKWRATELEEADAKAELLEHGCAVSSGRYVALIISDHTEEAVRLFPRAVNAADTKGYFDRYIQGARPVGVADPDPDYPDRTRFVPPNEEDMSLYDTSAILAAWEKGDPVGLSADDRAIYDSAEGILEEIIQDGMTDLEKETAAYRWLVDNVDYDWAHQDILAETSRRAYGPYGGLVDRAAVCLGYASSFQLLMDMSGVECITVVGACANSTGDHAWNMVRLDGEWYCVDVTWDANGREQRGESYAWKYFNVTSGEMAENHQWDYANTPEATAGDRD